ncbi:hypothetical protein Gotri_025742 [Gossypium trilobum]|uniref:Uncharacterized protein n=1 Tax=Gossypium trilobum TaxID=34281 RepID=A0A7J9FT14_9ROSI|nr:hypothetical protein [Gossypium trilobum]
MTKSIIYSTVNMVICFTFGKVYLVPTVEKYTTLLRYLRFQAGKAYSKAANVPTFLKRLMNIIGMSEDGSQPELNKKRIANASLGKVCGI